jgi:hypothetical protein
MRRSLFAATFVAVSILFSSAAAAQTLGCELNGPGGPIPASGTGGGTWTLFPTVFPPFPSVFPLNVVSTPVGATCVTEVRLNGLSHTYTNDVHFILEDPTGALYNLW